MLLKQEQVNPCEVDLEIQADTEMVQKAIDDVYKEYGKRTNVPGFRKGKAPRYLLERVVDKGKVRQFVIDKVLDDLYEEALTESGLKPVAVGSADVKQFELDDPEVPFIASVRVPLAPKVELGQYKGIEVKRKVHHVTDEEVDNEIESMLRIDAPISDVGDRPVQMGDRLQVAFGKVEEGQNEEKEDQQPIRTVIVGDNLPDLDQGLIGMKLDETKYITIHYPEDYDSEELRGQQNTFRVTIRQIREQVLPELTDEWVVDYWNKNKQQFPAEETIDTVEKLRRFVRDRQQEANERVCENALVSDLIDAIVQNAKIYYPQAIVDLRVQKRFEDLTRELDATKISFDQYLAFMRQSPEEYYEETKVREEESLRVGLALREIIDVEGIEATDEDVEKEIENLAQRNKVPVETIKAVLDRSDGLADIKRRVQEEKLMQFLKDSANIVVEEV